MIHLEEPWMVSMASVLERWSPCIRSVSRYVRSGANSSSSSRRRRRRRSGGRGGGGGGGGGQELIH